MMSLFAHTPTIIPHLPEPALPTGPVPAIRTHGLTKRYGKVGAVQDVDFQLMPGQFMALLGPSGCGKTTILRLLAGFETPTAGSIEIGGRLVAGAGRLVPPERRQVGMVFQDYALFPDKTVAQNVSYGVARRPDRAERVREVLRLVGLEDYGARMPHELSGGQQQRVALARALAPEPTVVLLDEPFSSLDGELRIRLRAETRQILTAAGASVIFVTHDQEEALSLADQVAVMRNGRILQIATPETLYRRPDSREVAQFVGDANFLPGCITDGQLRCDLGCFPAGDGDHSGDVEIMLRPEDIALEMDPAATNQVISSAFFGHDRIVTVCLPSGRHIRVRLNSHSPVTAGAYVQCRLVSAPRFFGV